jgi:hypothetical protein
MGWNADGEWPRPLVLQVLQHPASTMSATGPMCSWTTIALGVAAGGCPAEPRARIYALLSGRRGAMAGRSTGLLAVAGALERGRHAREPR